MSLNLANVLAYAHRYLWINRQDLFAYAFLPVVLLALIETAALWVSGDWKAMFEPVALDPNDPEALATVIRISITHLLRVVALAFAYVMFAIPWYRKQLVGDAGQRIGTVLSWSPRHWRFIFWSFALILGLAGLLMVFSLPMNALGAVIPGFNIVGPALLLIFVGLTGSRALMTFPAMAVDDPLGFRQSILLTQGRSWTLLGIAVLPLAGTIVLALILSNLIAAVLVPVIGPSISLMLVTVLLLDTLSFIGFAIQISALAFVYQQLIQKNSRSI
jgi:hypothetical protein